MTESDLIIRGGLLISASVLIGIFTGFLSEGAVNSEEESIECLVNDLERVIRSFSVSEPGSSMTLSFGEADVSDSISFPDRIGRNHIELEILPGMVLISMDGNRYPVIKDPLIIPIHVPVGERTISIEELKDLSRETGGFELEMPGSIELVNFDSGDRSAILIHTRLESNGPIGELIELEQIGFQPSSTFGKAIKLKGEKMNINSGGVIFWTGSATGIKEGICPLPWKLPPGTLLPDNLSIHSGEIRVIRQALMVSGDLYEDSWKVET